MKRRRNSFFHTAGEKRKFCNNVRYFGRTREIGLACFGLFPFMGFAVLAFFAVAAMFLAASFLRHDHAIASMHGKHTLATLLCSAGILGHVGLARQLREQRAKKRRDMLSLTHKKALTEEERHEWEKGLVEIDDLTYRIEMEEAAGPEFRTAPPENLPFGALDLPSETKEQRNAFRQYLRGGIASCEPEQRKLLVRDNSPIELRDMGTGGGNALQGTGGGFFVPVGFINDVEQAMLYYGGMMQAGTIMETATGQPLPYPTSNDTTVVGELVGEGVQVTTNDLSIGNLILNAWKYSTKMVKVSVELLQDSAFPIEDWLKQQFAIRLGRILNTHFTTGAGSGSSQPKGIITASVSGATAVGSSGNDGGAGTGANSIGSDDLVALEHSVDPLYRQGAAFMFHDSTLKFLKQLKDKYGRPLWLPGVSASEPGSILGYPYFINNDMDTIATTKKTVLFGQLKKYMIRRVKSLSVLRLDERFADFGQVAFIGFARYDGNLLDAGTHPVKFLTQA